MVKQVEPNVIFILDTESTFILEGHTYQILYSSNDLDKVLIDEDRFATIVILAELSWEEHASELFFGFDLANNFRRKYKLTCPIILTSTFEPKLFEQLAKKNPSKFNILYASGTHFLAVKDLYNLLLKSNFKNYVSQIPSISSATVEDMVEMLLQQRGFLIDKITHDLKFSLTRYQLLAAAKNIATYLSSAQKFTLAYDELISALCQAQKNHNESDFNLERSKLIDACNQFLVSETNENTSDKKSSDKLGVVLIVEDDPDQMKTLLGRLKKSFILKSTHQSQEAIKILEEDKKNEILGVIADWRMLRYENGNKTEYWQQQQGYQVLVRAAKTHFCARISLTAEHDKNVHQIRNQLGIAITLIKKEHFLFSNSTTHWAIFEDLIKDKCNEALLVISSQPTAVNWKKYRNNYINVRNSQKWISFELSVTQESDRLYKYFKLGLSFSGRDSIRVGLQEFLPLNSLKNILIGRRLFLALYIKFKIMHQDSGYISDSPIQSLDVDGVIKDNPLLDTYALLRNNWWNSETSNEKAEFKRYNQQVKNLLKALCIKSEEMYRVLPEEENWLANKNISLSHIT